MFRTDLDSLKMHQKELHRQAAKFRLAKSVEKPSRRSGRIYGAIGNVLVVIGQHLLSRAQAAY